VKPKRSCRRIELSDESAPLVLVIDEQSGPRRLKRGRSSETRALTHIRPIAAFFESYLLSIPAIVRIRAGKLAGWEVLQPDLSAEVRTSSAVPIKSGYLIKSVLIGSGSDTAAGGGYAPPYPVSRGTVLSSPCTRSD
jgi:hypothetical protein